MAPPGIKEDVKLSPRPVHMVLRTIFAPQQCRKNWAGCLAPHLNSNRKFSVLQVKNFYIVFYVKRLSEVRKIMSSTEIFFLCRLIMNFGCECTVFDQKIAKTLILFSKRKITSFGDIEKVKFDEYRRCASCKRKNDKKTKTGCSSCRKPICEEHRYSLCPECGGI